MASITTEPNGSKIGTTTIGATGGSALAGAIAIIIVWALTMTGIVVPVEVFGALVVVISAIGALIGGKLTPTNQTRVETQIVPVHTDMVNPPVHEIPDGSGAHRAETI